MKRIIRSICFGILPIGFILISCNKEIPTLTTAEITNITATSADSGGNIIDDGSWNIVFFGVCWSRYPNPTSDLSTRTNQTNAANNLGIFSSTLNGLSPNTTYYVRAYAFYSFRDEYHTCYGNEIAFKTAQN